MTLQRILEELPRERRLPFLRQAYRPGRQDVAEALITELETIRESRIRQMYGEDEQKEFNEVIARLIIQAEESGNKEKADVLRLKRITSHFYAGDIEKEAKSSADPGLIEKIIETYRGDHWSHGEMVTNLLEHLGMEDEAREYDSEVIRVLDEQRKRRLEGGGKWGNHGVDKIYMRLGMYKEAVEIRLDDKDFSEAIKLAQKHLEGEELTEFYKRVYSAVEGDNIDNGFPIQVRVAELLEDEKLTRDTKKRYVDWIMNESDRTTDIDLVREVGTKRQLRKMHERIVTYHQQRETAFKGHFMKMTLEDLAEVAEEAYKDTKQKKYVCIAMETYERLGDLQKALECAWIVDENKAEVLKEALSFTTK